MINIENINELVQFSKLCFAGALQIIFYYKQALEKKKNNNNNLEVC